MRPLRKYLVGEKITADMINGIVDSIRESQVNSVVGGTFKRSAGGTTISISAPPKSASVVAPPTICPFDPQVTSTTSGYEVSFSAGTINGILPTNMFSPLTGVSTSGITYFYIKCTTDGKLLTTAVIEKSTSVRTPQASNADTAPTTLNVLIGYMTTAGTAAKTIPCSNITARVFPTIQENNVTFVAGQRNFKQYYNWGF
jgi:hypothetical protein